jgi:hypothetical protein
VAAALNDRGRSQIGDPRRGTYHVSLVVVDREDIDRVERALASLDVRSRTNPTPGRPFAAYVTIYGQKDQRHLFEVVEQLLERDRHNQFEDLVRARGEITPELLDRIRRADGLGWSPEMIAAKLNEGGYIDGMGGIRWTAKKVKKLLA